jgi:L-aminopeptidase/D-esterase-like protein
MRFLEERNIGRDVGVTRVPNVCAAILFDLKCGSSIVRPNAQMGYLACQNAGTGNAFQSGNFGAGTGATIGKVRGLNFAMKGGIGAAAFQFGELKAGAVVAVNCGGDVVENGKIIAGARSDDGVSFTDSELVMLADYCQDKDFFIANTVLGCVISNADVDKAGATRIAEQGQNGIARAVRPAHSVFDGDTVFAMCSGEVKATADAVSILAAMAVEAAIIDAVKSAETLFGYPAVAALRRS